MTTIEASFTKVDGDDAGHLIYEIQARDTNDVNKNGACVIEGLKCTVGGLNPGRKYSLSVRACISEDHTICGEFSPETLGYTVPTSTCGHIYSIFR